MLRQLRGRARSFFAPYLRWRWLGLCVGLGALLFGIALATEWSHRGRPGFSDQLAQAAFYCFAIPFGLFAIVVLIHAMVRLGRMRDELLSNLPDVLHYAASSAQLPLAPGEGVRNRVRGAVLEVAPGQIEWVNVVITDRGLYIEFPFKKIPTALLGLFGRPLQRGEHVLRLHYDELASARAETRDERQHVWHTMVRKDGATLTLRLPKTVQLQPLERPRTPEGDGPSGA